VTKSLRADYANPLSIAHKVLADRMTQRDPGNAPASGERIGYIYITKPGQEASKLQGDRIETPLYVKENNLVPDYKHYIEHQLQNPISQAFGLLLERIPGFTPSMVAKCPNPSDEKMLEAWLGFRENIAAKLLFGDCLKKFETSSRHNAIYNMFGGAATITQHVKSAQTEKVKMVQKPLSQKPISSFLLDSFIVSNIKKNERATKAKETKAKKIKESI
jgi:hypothetical protein